MSVGLKFWRCISLGAGFCTGLFCVRSSGGCCHPLRFCFSLELQSQGLSPSHLDGVVFVLVHHLQLLPTEGRSFDQIVQNLVLVLAWYGNLKALVLGATALEFQSEGLSSSHLDGVVFVFSSSPSVVAVLFFLLGLDFVIAEARRYGIKLVLSLVNNYDSFGGKKQYVNWARSQGQYLTSDDDFFRNPVVKGYYKNHVKTVLNRYNTMTGIVYKNDPTIMAWELMNEPRCTSDPSGRTIQGWVMEMASYVKSIDRNHLLEAGLEGFYGQTTPQRKRLNPGYNIGTDFIANNRIPGIDFATVHSYPDICYTSALESETSSLFSLFCICPRSVPSILVFRVLRVNTPTKLEYFRQEFSIPADVHLKLAGDSDTIMPTDHMMPFPIVAFTECGLRLPLHPLFPGKTWHLNRDFLIPSGLRPITYENGDHFPPYLNQQSVAHCDRDFLVPSGLRPITYENGDHFPPYLNQQSVAHCDRFFVPFRFEPGKV
ncbi:hypothetical protein TEA_023467 [Camellia sinensis var. sinensis]|uniref:mannan endo-1,4-beta-mannosidase n=1 Tax=Camellia sinensis var. sinensis TaxID=542762 RepID=A0A4S4EGW2_CAMSN|nr:hypothetical protein TEA_023467 [Camellia sinensis var. sinensis]